MPRACPRAPGAPGGALICTRGRLCHGPGAVPLAGPLNPFWTHRWPGRSDNAFAKWVAWSPSRGDPFCRPVVTRLRVQRHSLCLGSGTVPSISVHPRNPRTEVVVAACPIWLRPSTPLETSNCVVAPAGPPVCPERIQWPSQGHCAGSVTQSATGAYQSTPGAVPSVLSVATLESRQGSGFRRPAAAHGGRVGGVLSCICVGV